MRTRLLAAALLMGLARTAPAQTAADTASVILQVARDLQRDGRPDAARELFRHLHARYSATPAARAADSLMRALPGSGPNGNGQSGFVTFNTADFAFLGAALPAAFDAHGSGDYGVGLLVEAPTGFVLSRACACAHFRSPARRALPALRRVGHLAGTRDPEGALLQWQNGVRLTLPTPEPAAFQIVNRAGKVRLVPGARLRLFNARF